MEKTFQLDNSLPQKQLVIFANELFELIMFKGQMTINNSRRSPSFLKDDIYDLQTMTNEFRESKNYNGYIDELKEEPKENLIEIIKFYEDALDNLKVPYDHILELFKKDVYDLLDYEENESLGKMLKLAWGYGDEVVREKIIGYVNDETRIAFDIAGENVPEGKTNVTDKVLTYHLSNKLENVPNNTDSQIKGALILAHEFHHTGDDASSMAEELDACMSTIKMLASFVEGEGYSLQDDNLKAQWEMYNALGEQGFKDVIQSIKDNTAKNFPMMASNKELYAYYEMQFIFLKPFISAKDYEDNIKKYVADSWAMTLYELGRYAGIIPGIAQGLWSTLVAIKDLIVLLGKAKWEEYKFYYKHATDPVNSLKQDVDWLSDSATIAKEVMSAIISNPGIIMDVFKGLGSLISDEITKKLTAWAKKKPFYQGYDIGEMVGMIVFEVATWFIGVGEVSAAVKGAGLLSKLLSVLSKLKLDKLGKLIEKIVEITEALRLSKLAKTYQNAIKELDGKTLTEAAGSLKMFGYQIRKSKSGKEFIQRGANTAKELPELVLESGKIKIASVAEIEDAAKIMARYEESCRRSIDEVAKAFKARNGKALTKLEIATILKSDAPPPRVLGRIVSGDYKTMSGKELAWVLDPAEVEGLTNVQIMKRIGWKQEDIDKIMRMPVDKRKKLSIKLVEDPGNLKVPTWDSLKGEVLKSLKDNAKFKKDFIDEGLNPGNIEQYIEILKKTPQDKMSTLTGEVKKFRDILESKFGCNPLFTNSGFTITPTGKFGLREWIRSKPDVGWDLPAMEKAGFKVRDVELLWED